MDENMEENLEVGFHSLEIDLDYEFDAFHYFDFSRGESISEARDAELWFVTAGSYPPSPYAMKLNMSEDALVKNVNTIPKSKDAEHTNSITSQSNIGMGSQFSVPDKKYGDCDGFKDEGFLIGCPMNDLQNGQHAQQTSTSSVLDHVLSDSTGADCHRGDGVTKGCTFYDMAPDISKAQRKPVIKASVSRGSTLMKPTASQLAKQNYLQVVKGSHQFVKRIQKPLVQKSGRSIENPSGNESQAAKRQKLEGGHLFKVIDMMQQVNLVHKVPRKQQNGPTHCNSEQSRLKLTIPREPELETAQRAQRMRPKNGIELSERVLPAMHMFKARPLNRKILEAPSLPLPQKSTPRLPEFQEFHLKTSERAMQHLSTASSSLLSCTDSDKVMPNQKTSSVIEIGAPDSKNSGYQPVIPSQPQKTEVVDHLRREQCEIMPKFIARPLNKKIFSSKGDIGVFRTSKRETTTPTEFNFSTDRQFQHNPPIELFSKLSLTSELQQNITSLPKLSRPSHIKGLKENMTDSLLQEHNITNIGKDKLESLGGKKIHYGTGGGMIEIRPRGNMCRSLGIR
ncbi:protein TPX2-like isoform X3 [Tasmannia lanceolata]|uniref:protein TPX2-like isoform X3 n=1 Tax=Tasmannia lanceolata TaxID=3420 RepID=UPI004064BC74